MATQFGPVELDDGDVVAVARAPLVTAVDVADSNLGAARDQRQQFLDQNFAQMTAGPAVDVDAPHADAGARPELPA